MLEVLDVRKQFSPGNPVLKGISVSVHKGDVIAILGPSGSGKTTLLRCMNYLEIADSGKMLFDGVEYDMHRITKKEMAAIRLKTAFVFQNYNLFLNKNVLQNVTLGLIHGHHIPFYLAESAAKEALERVGMSHKLDAYPSELSGGQQQRVAIARGLAGKPEIIFFDEPTSALDPELIGEVLGVMRRLAEEGMTMVVVTHEMEFARNVSNHVFFLDRGVVVESAPSAEFFSHPKEERTRSFIRSILKKEETPAGISQ